MATILATEASSVEGTLEREIPWQKALKLAIRDGNELLKHLGLPFMDTGKTLGERQFPVFVPWEYVRRMEPGNPHDPLLLQVAAAGAEGLSLDSGIKDPVGDSQSELQPGLLKKYDRRVLIITTGACAVHCRYCFRRHYPYQNAPKGAEGWSRLLKSVREDESIDEVILSGGDPLTLVDEQLQWLVAEIGRIDHIQRLRIHTRVPVVLPQRVTDTLCATLESSRATPIVILHFNHRNEIDQAVEVALRRLRRGALLLNQAVMLRGVNDSYLAQRDLCLELSRLQVLPYYLHQLDYVDGATHYAVDDEDAKKIVSELQRTLPGYAVPKLVREVAGESGKTPL